MKSTARPRHSEKRFFAYTESSGLRYWPGTEHRIKPGMTARHDTLS
ncbi:MAG: hypothetical protein ACI8VC_000844 [Candidatus Endobugula sp.]|jgi:hypothetical protein